MARKRRKKVATESPHLALCGRCGKVSGTLDDGMCTPCRLAIRAEEAAASTPPPPPEPEPPPVERPRFLGAPKGCFRCGREGEGLLCNYCRSALYGAGPGSKEGDPVIKRLPNLTICGY